MEVMEVDTPDIGVDEVLVKVGTNTICGPDVRFFVEKRQKASIHLSIHPSTILGYEMTVLSLR